MSYIFENYEKNLDKILIIGREAVKESNKNPNFTKLWRDFFSKSKSVGYNGMLLEKYGVADVNGSIDDKTKFFIKSYLEDEDPYFNKVTSLGSLYYGRCVWQVKIIAETISRACIDRGVIFDDSMEKDIERIMCLILYHVCYETSLGKFVEKTVENYFSKRGFTAGNKTGINERIWDSNGVDIILYKDGKIFRFIQVKPTSFICGGNCDLIADREACFTKYQPFVDGYVEKHPCELHQNAKTDIVYCFYDKQKDCNFVNFKNRNDDYGIFIGKDDFAFNNGETKYIFEGLNRFTRVDINKL